MRYTYPRWVLGPQVRDQHIVAKAVIEKAGKSGFPLRVAGIAMNPDNRFITLAGIENALQFQTVMAFDLPGFMGQLLNFRQGVVNLGDGIEPAVLRSDHFIGLVDIRPPQQLIKYDLSLHFFKHSFTSLQDAHCIAKGEETVALLHSFLIGV